MATANKPPEKAAPKDAEPVITNYTVLKAITLGNGQTLMPGETLAIADTDPEWPDRRPAQLVKQKFLQAGEG